MSDKEDKVSSIPSLEDHHMMMFFKDFDASAASDGIEFIITRNLMRKDRPKMIKMLINSPGGEVSSAFALIDTMKGSKIPIYTYGLGEIASCGLMTFIAGEKGHRYITRNTAILSHQYSWGSWGKEHELMARVKEFNNTQMRIVEHYKKCTGLNEKDIKKYLLPPEDVWLTAKEAVKYGIADEIVDFY
jgi:ATP-dependent Clp protease protease subunit